jgi:hypothetical protein
MVRLLLNDWNLLMPLGARTRIGLTLGACLCLVAQSPAVIGADTPTTAPTASSQSASTSASSDADRSAVYLLRSALTYRRDGKHNTLLRALRQMRDPALSPIFVELSQSDNPTLRVHGILGLADCDPKRKLDLVRIASISEPASQAEAVSAALDSEMVTPADAAQLVSWPGLDLAVRILVCTQLIKSQPTEHVELLLEASKADNLGRRSMAGLMLLQCDRPEGRKILDDTGKSTDPRRDAVREMLLSAAMRYEFDKAGPWAMAVASEPGVNARLSLMALRVAIRFSVPGASDLWKQMFDSTTDPAQRMRLALAALNMAQHLDTRTAQTLSASDDALIKRIGLVTSAIVAGRSVAEPAVALISSKDGPPVIGDWALLYVKRQASAVDGPAMLMAMIQAANSTEGNKAQRIDDAVSATQMLIERYPDQAPGLLRPFLTDPKTDPLAAQGVLIGVIRADSSRAYAVVADLPPPSDLDVQGLLLLLRARQGLPLDEAQMNELATLVRGGGALRTSDALRLQAAWIYLKRTKQTEQTLAAVLGK